MYKKIGIMETDNREKIDGWLLALCAGEALGEEEQRLVDAWLAEGEENRLYYERLQIDFLRFRWVLRESLIAHRDAPRYRLLAARKRRIRRLCAAAAVVCLLVGTGVLWQGRETERNTVGEMAGVIVPGQSKAKLYLSSGEEVLLGNNKEVFIDREVVRISMDGEGTLAYRDTAQLSEIVYNRLTVERGGEYKIELADGSVVWVNSDSELEYPVRFSGNRRVVELKGEAYFAVHSDTARPFVVVANEVEVEAVGTEFCVNSRVRNRVTSVLVEGRILVGKQAEKLALQPNQLAVYDCVSEQVVEVRTVDVRKYVDWKTGDFIFSDDRLEEVMEKLALWYDCDVVFADEALKEVRLSGNMKRYDKIEKFLRFLRLSTGTRFEIKGNTVYVYKK